MMLHARFLSVLIVLGLTASLTVNVILYPGATRPLVMERHQPFVDRTIAAAASEGVSAEEMRTLFPITMQTAQSICVELRSRYGRGHHGACFDERTGEVEQTASVSHPPSTLGETLERFSMSTIVWP